jgi:hypothetical protein
VAEFLSVGSTDILNFFGPANPDAPSQMEDIPEEIGVDQPGQGKLMVKLLSFVCDHGEMLPVLAGYWGKVMKELVKARKACVLKNVFHTPGVVPGFLRHVSNNSVADILGQLLTDERRPECQVWEAQYAKLKLDCINDLLTSLSPTKPPELMRGACLVLYVLISADQSLDHFLSTPVVSRLYAYCLSGNPMSIRTALTLLVLLISKSQAQAAIEPAKQPSILCILKSRRDTECECRYPERINQEYEVFQGLPLQYVSGKRLRLFL